MSNMDEADIGVHLRENDSSCTNQKRVLYSSNLKSRKIFLYLAVVFLVIVVVLAIIGYVIFDSSSTNSPSSDTISTANANSQKQVEMRKPTDSKCVRHTPQQYLDTLPNNIDDLCHPIEKETGGTHPGMTACGIGSKIYVYNFCLCDKTTNCVKTSFDNYRRKPCSNCSNNNHCPCQNNGTCNPCQNHVQLVSCKCSHGTTGYYCTKISSRLCHVSKEHFMTTMENCITSNNKTCFSREYSKSLVCEWSDTLMDDYPRCSNETLRNIGIQAKPELLDSQGYTVKKETSNNTASKNCFIGIIILGVFSLISLLLFVYKSRRRQ